MRAEDASSSHIRGCVCIRRVFIEALLLLITSFYTRRSFQNMVRRFLTAIHGFLISVDSHTFSYLWEEDFLVYHVTPSFFKKRMLHFSVKNEAVIFLKKSSYDNELFSFLENTKRLYMLLAVHRSLSTVIYWDKYWQKCFHDHMTSNVETCWQEADPVLASLHNDLWLTLDFSRSSPASAGFSVLNTIRYTELRASLSRASQFSLSFQ